MTDARNDRLVWIDLEMTGLAPATDRIIEIAVVVTDPQLSQRVEGPVFAIHQADAVLDAMDAWNKGTHGRSGLTERVRASLRNEPSILLVIMDTPRLWMPRVVMHSCAASITTPTPRGCSTSLMQRAISAVIFSCTWKRRANTSTTRASFEMPTTFVVGR